MTTLADRNDLLSMSDEEIQAQNLADRGEIDEAIAIYQCLKPTSARVFNEIGLLYDDKKGDYDTAIKYYEKALQIQEENDEDTSNTLTNLAFAYQNRHEFDLALVYHCRALSIRQMLNNIDKKLVANNLVGIANAYWGLQNLSEALSYAQQALTLNESIESGNDFSIATNLAILANIYHKFKNDIQALELAKRALILFEGCGPPDSPALLLLLNNLGTIQVAAGLFNDGLLTFIRVFHIYEKSLPEEHPKRVTIENNIRRIREMQRVMDVNPYSHLWTFLSKISLL